VQRLCSVSGLIQAEAATSSGLVRADVAQCYRG
ncbi:hypothetical protein A2U01_0060690, partial [Trifolium medium]|nr:hypothetical protein [Trifolium medium]